MDPLHRTGSDCFSDADFIAINRSRIDGAISSRDGGSDHFCCFLIWHLPDAEAKLGNYVAVIEANGWLGRHIMVGSVPFLLSSFRIAPSAVRSLQDNYHFLYPITKSDVCSLPPARPVRPILYQTSSLDFVVTILRWLFILLLGTPRMSSSMFENRIRESYIASC